jgi:hypothetical protein
MDETMTTKNKQKINTLLTSACSQVVCCANVGDQKSLSIGLGTITRPKKSALKNSLESEWLLGSYRCCWRIVERGKIILTNHSLDETIETLNRKVSAIKYGKLLRISNHTDHDVRVEFENNISIDFLATFNDDDERFHLFCPSHEYVEFYSDGKWRTGKSDAPWLRDAEKKK